MRFPKIKLVDRVARSVTGYCWMCFGLSRFSNTGCVGYGATPRAAYISWLRWGGGA